VNGQQADWKKIKTRYPVPHDALSTRIFFDTFDEDEADDQSLIKVSRESSTAAWQRPASLKLRADKVEVNAHILCVIDGMVTPMRGRILG
jgi:hypothetical protein